MADRDMLMIVRPAQHLRKVVAQAPAGTPLILCSKGIEAGTGLLMSEVAAQAQPALPIAVLFGLSFALGVARGLPTGVRLADTQPDLDSTGLGSGKGVKVHDDPGGRGVIKKNKITINE